MNKKIRKICVVTGSRAEYGLLYWLLKEIQVDGRFQLQLVVTGMHLASAFGETIKQIEADGFIPDVQVKMLLDSDTPTGIAKSIALGIAGFADTFEQLKPDLLVILGDRFEILAAAQTAMIARIPIAHIHGGERTEGAIDEAIRHAITKMSHLHFVASEEYRKRVIQLGEMPQHVWNVGALGLDTIRRVEFMSREALTESIGFDLSKPYFVMTYHPATLERHPDKGIHALLQVLGKFSNHRVVITGVNADTGYSGIQKAIATFTQDHPGRVFNCISLGQQRYLSLLRYADAVLGNSSSGIIEAPALAIPTVNIGDRQRGRVRANSVIDVEENTEAIEKGIRKALSQEFRTNLKTPSSLLGDGYVAPKIVSILAEIELKGTLMKQFQDL